MHMKLKPSVIVISLATAAVAVAGSAVTDPTGAWYQTLVKPAWQPPGWLFGVVWSVLFVMIAISAITAWKAMKRDLHFGLTFDFFILNAFLNFFWSFLFFNQHALEAATLEAALLAFTVYVLMYLIWPASKKAALLLLPYALWVTFATYLTYTVASLN